MFEGVGFQNEKEGWDLMVSNLSVRLELRLIAENKGDRE